MTFIQHSSSTFYVPAIVPRTGNANVEQQSWTLPGGWKSPGTKNQPYCSERHLEGMRGVERGRERGWGGGGGRPHPTDTADGSSQININFIH